MKQRFIAWLVPVVIAFAVALSASVVQNATAQNQREQEQERPPVGANGLLNSIPGGVPIDNEMIAHLLITPKHMPRIAFPTKVRVSAGVMSSLLIKKVNPHYPPEALQQHVAGTVILRVNIDKNGDISNIEAVSGDSMLIPAAIEAVQQWRYRPYLLNRVPVEVETEVQINFVIAGTNPQVPIASASFSTSHQIA